MTISPHQESESLTKFDVTYGTTMDQHYKGQHIYMYVMIEVYLNGHSKDIEEPMVSYSTRTFGANIGSIPIQNDIMKYS